MSAQVTHRRQVVCILAGALLAGVGVPWGTERASAQAINPQAFKAKFDQEKGKADVVAAVRVLAVACTKAAKGEEGENALTLEMCMQVEKAEKGAAKTGEMLLVRHQINWSNRLGPPALYGRQSTKRSFPCVAGTTGEVALRWDAEHRCYAALAGWVPQLPAGDPPTDVGKVSVAGAK
jgi:hypothetical protein